MKGLENYLTDGTKEIIKRTCIERQDKGSLPRCCKGCPYRYRGEHPEKYCCMFADTPDFWS